MGGLSLAGMAQDLPRPMSPPVSDPEIGHSAAYYGLPSPGLQEASIRSVLSSVQVDQAFVPLSLAAESAYFLVRLFVGGQGAPTDLADSIENVPLGARQERRVSEVTADSE